jgi:hypothetical protein
MRPWQWTVAGAVAAFMICALVSATEDDENEGDGRFDDRDDGEGVGVHERVDTQFDPPLPPPHPAWCPTFYLRGNPAMAWINGGWTNIDPGEPPKNEWPWIEAKR